MGEASGPATGMTKAHDLVWASAKAGHPRVILGQLVRQVERLLDEGQPEKIIKAALEEWDATPDIGPQVLPYIVSNVVRRRKPKPPDNNWEDKLREEMGG